MNKKILVGGVVAIFVLTGGAFIFMQKKVIGNEQGASPPGQTETSGAPAALGEATGVPSSPVLSSAVKEFTVTGSNYSFDPKTMSVVKGETVKIIFKNADGTHDLVIDEFNVHTKRIRAGEEDSVQFIADKAGTFEYYCSVGNHRAMGMKGTLTVE